jgi:hypothetical protein
MHQPIKPIPAMLFLVALAAPSAQAASTFVDWNLFQDAISGFGTYVESFETVTAGELIQSGDSLGALQFNYTFADSLRLAVSGGDSFGGFLPAPTYDGVNFLATNDGDLLVGGDDFGVAFNPTRLLGLWIISEDEVGVDIRDGDLVLNAAGTSVALDIDSLTAIGNNNFAYFLGIVDETNPFTSATLTAAVSGAPLFAVDYIVIEGDTFDAPVPASPLLMMLGLAGLAAVRRSNARPWQRSA